MLRCLAVAGDGLGQQEHNDGGILSTVMAAGFKGKQYCWYCSSFVPCMSATLVLELIVILEFQEKPKVMLK